MWSGRRTRASSCAAPKYETAAAYAHQAFVKPTIANWGDAKLSDYALGFICPMNAGGLKHICRNGFAGVKPAADYPLSNGFDEVDTSSSFDNVTVPWENVLFYRHTPGGELHPRHAAPTTAPTCSCCVSCTWPT